MEGKKKSTSQLDKNEWGYEIVKDFIKNESADYRELNCEVKD